MDHFSAQVACACVRNDTQGTQHRSSVTVCKEKGKMLC
jgi:hypothetical protein